MILRWLTIGACSGWLLWAAAVHALEVRVVEPDVPHIRLARALPSGPPAIHYFLAPEGGARILFDAQGRPLLLSRNSREESGSLRDLTTGKIRVRSPLLRGTSRRAVAPDGDGWLVVVANFWEGGGAPDGVYRMAADGRFEKVDPGIALKRLGDIVPRPGGGFWLVEFYADNLFAWQGPGSRPQPLFEQGTAPGDLYAIRPTPGGMLYLVAVHPTQGGGLSGIPYRFQAGKAQRLQSRSLYGAYQLGWSSGRLFPEGLYSVDWNCKCVLRLKADGETEQVVAGLWRPIDVQFDAQGAMWLIDRRPAGDLVVRIGPKAGAPAYLQPLDPAVTRLPGLPIRDALVSADDTWAITNQDGYADLGLLSAGPVRLEVVHPAHLRRQAEVTAEGEEIPVVLLQAAPPASVAGRVASADGKPLAGAYLEFRQLDDVVARDRVILATDEAGRYRIPRLLSGRYEVRILAQGHTAAHRTLRIGGGENRLDFRLSPGAQGPLPPLDRFERGDRPRPLALETAVGATLWPEGDTDEYRVELPGPGLLEIHGWGWGKVLRVHRAGEKKPALEKRFGGRTRLAYFAEGRHTITLKVTGLASRAPYRLALHWLPADPFDSDQRNDRPASATPVPDNTVLTGNLLPKGDRDLYRVEVDFPGVLRAYDDRLRNSVCVRWPSTQPRRDCQSSEKPWEMALDTLPGGRILEVTPWNPGSFELRSYRVKLRLDRAEPDEADALERLGRWRKGLDARTLIGTRWTFSRADGTRIGSLVLRPGGRIEGYRHPNEHHWAFEDGRLLFFHESGKPSTRFERMERIDGRWRLSGPFLLDDKGTVLVLEEANLPGTVLRGERPRPLRPGVGRAFTIDLVDDRDLFEFTAPKAGTWHITLVSPFYHEAVIRKAQGGEPLRTLSGKRTHAALELKQGERLHIDVGDDGDHHRWPDPGVVVVSEKQEVPGLDRILVRPGASAGEVLFTREGVRGMVRALEVRLHPTGKEKQGTPIPRNGALRHRYAQPGLYRARLRHRSRPHLVAVDGRFLQNTSRWDGPGTVWWKGTDFNLVLDAGRVAQVADLRLQVDNNDDYLVEHSLDGRNWRPLLKIERNMGRVNWGMDSFSTRSRDEGYLEQLAFRPVKARYLRLRATGGDCCKSVSEIVAFDPAGDPIPLEPVGPDLWVEQTIWVDARGLSDAGAPQLALEPFAPNGLAQNAKPVVAHVRAGRGARVKQVRFELDGQPLATLFKAPFRVEPPWARLGAGEHRLVVEAEDTLGRKTRVERSFRLSETFGLEPEDGARLTGRNVRVSWVGRAPGPARLQYRRTGEGRWHELRGRPGRQRSLVIRDLAPGYTYEYRIATADGWSPIRRFHLLKGLAFTQARFGATIDRDYDQRVGIEVVNNGDEPLEVHLEAGRPEDPRLLAGFVGEGSADQPATLKPGERRRFFLGVSAQDVVTAEHTLPVRILADNGLSDEAEVKLLVRLPRVDLQWKDLGLEPDGMTRRFALYNAGDTLTDLNLTARHPDKVEIIPAVNHGKLAAGERLEVRVRPVLDEGFRGVSTELVARALEREFTQPYRLRLAPGEKVHWLLRIPGYAPTDPDYLQALQRHGRNYARAADLDPAALDWSGAERPEDLDGDGRPDRWHLNVDDTAWSGDDTDGDGKVDFVHADVGRDGVYDYSAYFDGNRWRETNLVEAWLEMGFSLPWNRRLYHPHDVDILFNGEVIGRLRDTVPEGNYSFRIPPRLIRFGKDGRPAGNQVSIRSRHLRGGHYVVNSEFRFKFRFTAIPFPVVARNDEEARRRAAAVDGIDERALDLSLAATGLRIEGPEKPKAGDAMVLKAALRNLGSMVPPWADLVLERAFRDGRRTELARVRVETPALEGLTPVRIPFKAPGGDLELHLKVVPPAGMKDMDPANDETVRFLHVAGDDTPPRVAIEAPSAPVPAGVFQLMVQADDDQELARVAVSVDGGLWQTVEPFSGRQRIPLLLQPGRHEIRWRAEDGSGNVGEARAEIVAQGEGPAIEELTPADGSRAGGRVQIRFHSPDALILAAARVDEGPWRKAAPTGASGHWQVTLPLGWGEHPVDVMAVNPAGVATLRRITLVGTEEAPKADARNLPDKGVVWLGPHLDLRMDLFAALDGLLVHDAASREERARRLVKEAEYRQAHGDFAGARNKYREALRLKPDPRIQDRYERLDFYLQLQ